MKYFLIAVAGLALAACGGAKDKAADSANKAAEATSEAATATTEAASDMADAAGEMASDAVDSAETSLAGITRADYLKACGDAEGVTMEQCECTLGVYESVGLDFNDLEDAQKVQDAMAAMTPEQMQTFAGCVS